MIDRRVCQSDPAEVPEAAAIIDMLDLLSTRIRFKQQRVQASAQLEAPVTVVDFLELIKAIEAIGTNADQTFADVAKGLEGEKESYEDAYENSYDKEAHDDSYEEKVPQK